MGYRSDVVIVMWKPDFEEFTKQAKELNDAWLMEMANNAKSIVTPDEEYKVINEEWVKWYDEYPAVRFMNKFLADKRHSFARIGEDNDDIEIETKSWDDRGTDEEFDYIVGIERKIVIEGLEK